GSQSIRTGARGFHPAKARHFAESRHRSTAYSFADATEFGSRHIRRKGGLENLLSSSARQDAATALRTNRTRVPRYAPTPPEVVSYYVLREGDPESAATAVASR